MSWPRAGTPPCAGTPPPQNRPPKELCPHRRALLVQGNPLRNVELRSRLAHITLAGSPPAPPRHMVEPRPDPHHPHTGPRRSSRHPLSMSFVLASLRALHIDSGTRRLLRTQPGPEPPVRRARKRAHKPRTAPLTGPFHISSSLTPALLGDAASQPPSGCRPSGR
jgi:hypothetical protein